jgi:hypothetical protein
MSIPTWMQEFCVATDLEKWVGLLPSNMEKHGVTLNSNRRKLEDIDGNSFSISGLTCECCHRFAETVEMQCPECPIYKELGNKRCDIDADVPFALFTRYGYVEPMITVLEKVKDKLPLRSKSTNFYYGKKIVNEYGERLVRRYLDDIE